MKERRVFLFEQIVIFSEPLDKKRGFSMPGYLYKYSIKVQASSSVCFLVSNFVMIDLSIRLFRKTKNIMFVCVQVSCLGLEDSVDGDPCKFALTSRTSNGSKEAFILHSSHPGVRQVWMLQISQILESQRNFLNGTATSNTYEHKRLLDFRSSHK